MGGVIEEVGAAGLVHQGVEESVKVTGGGVGEEVDALFHGLVAELPHLIPGGGDFPALFLKEALVVEEAAGAVEHGGEVGLAVGVGVGARAVVHEALDDLVADSDVLTGDGHGQNVGDLGDVLVLDELLGQAGLTAGGQVDDVGELAALHGGADDVLEVLVDNELDVDAGLSREGVADFLPHAGVCLLIAGSQSRHGDGHVGSGGRVVAGGGGVSVLGGGIAGGGLSRSASGKNAQSQHEHEEKRKEFLHFHSSFLKICRCNLIPNGWHCHPSMV